MGDDDPIDPKQLVQDMVGLALVAKPGQSKTIKKTYYQITLRAKKGFTGEAFLLEHDGFLKALSGLSGKTDES
jgi:hypothetical protein